MTGHHIYILKKNRNQIFLTAFAASSALVLFCGEITCFGESSFQTYDSLNRLTGVTYPSGLKLEYTYDANGNRLTHRVIPATRIIQISGNPDFGSVDPGGSGTTTLTISNTGNSPLTVSSIDFPDGYTGDWSGGELAAGASRQVLVSFSPLARLSYVGEITIHSDATSGSGTTSLSGTGSPPAELLRKNLLVEGLSDSASSERLFKLRVPRWSSNLRITSTGGTGGWRLYARNHALPSSNVYDARSEAEAETTETLVIPSPEAGNWQVMLKAAEQYDDIDLLATYTVATAQSPRRISGRAIDSRRIRLQWGRGSHHYYYQVERNRQGSAAWAKVVQTGAASVRFLDRGLRRNTRYRYRVIAFNGDAEPGRPSRITTVRTKRR